MKQPVLIVQHEPSVPPGNILGVLEDEGVDHVVLEAWRGDAAWPRTEEVSAVVVLGGTMNVDQVDAYPFLRRSRALLRRAIEEDVPTLGVCLGAQMTARALQAEVRRAPQRSARFAPLELTAEGRRDPVTAPFSSGQPVLQFHEDTFAIPAEATLLARSRAGVNQAFRYGDRNYAIQFHFEVDAPIVEGWIASIGDRALTREWGSAPADLARQVSEHLAAQDRAGRQAMRAFLRLTT